MRIYNSATHKKEEFQPIEPGKVRMYVCGPTVYDNIHIGNARTFISFDVIRRWLIASGYEVTFAQNLTDVDDKIIKRANEQGRTAAEVATEFSDKFIGVMRAANVLDPDVRPRATKEIGPMIAMIKALIELYEITGEQRYLTFADDYIDFFVQDDGTIKHYNPQEYNLDNVNAGKTLYKLYDLVGKPKYRAAMDTIYRQLETQPRTKEGVFWHKAVYPNQIWLDGMYMAQPFYMQYELSFHNRRACSDSFHMFQVVHDLMRNPLNGLYYHAYDASRKQFWCDPVTGLSANFWLRAEGWFAMALIDTWELMPPSMSAEKDEIRKMFHDLIDAMLPYQDEKTGMWHQVINLPNIAPNYLEESGSAIFANAIMKGVRLGVLGERYYQYGRRAFDGICDTCLSEHDGQLALDNICLVAGLGNTAHREGTFGYYMSEPVVKNDAKGVAPLVLAYIETIHHDKLDGKRDPLAPSGVCSIEDPFGGYTPGINAHKGCE